MEALSHVLAALAGFVMVFGVLSIAYGGFKYAVSQGEPHVVEQARSQIVSGGMATVCGMAVSILVRVASASLPKVPVQDIAVPSSDPSRSLTGFGAGAAAIGLVSLVVIGLVAYFLLKRSEDSGEAQSESRLHIEELMSLLQADGAKLDTDARLRFEKTIRTAMEPLKRGEAMTEESRMSMDSTISGDIRSLYEAYAKLGASRRKKRAEELFLSLDAIDAHAQKLKNEMESGSDSDLEQAMSLVELRYSEDR